MQSTSCEMPGWMKLKLESRFLGEISKNSCSSRWENGRKIRTLHKGRLSCWITNTINTPAGLTSCHFICQVSIAASYFLPARTPFGRRCVYNITHWCRKSFDFLDSHGHMFLLWYWNITVLNFLCVCGGEAYVSHLDIQKYQGARCMFIWSYMYIHIYYTPF